MARYSESGTLVQATNSATCKNFNDVLTHQIAKQEHEILCESWTSLCPDMKRSFKDSGSVLASQEAIDSSYQLAYEQCRNVRHINGE